MTLIDKFTHKCLAIRVAHRINAIGPIETLSDAMLFEGVPTFIRSDDGLEMAAKILRQWLSGLGTKSLYIAPGSLWENGYCESFNGNIRHELLNARSSTASGRPRGSLRNGEPITTSEGRPPPSDTIRQYPSTSCRCPRSTGPQTCNSLSLRLVQYNAGQADLGIALVSWTRSEIPTL